jgi:uncharacterized protein YbjT (DUF2867 family)
MNNQDQIVVLSGSTGYVGQLILQGLAERFGEVRCLTRSPGKLNDLPDNCRSMKVDLLIGDEIDVAMAGASTAFYLVHSLDESDDFETLEYESARLFAQAAAKNNLQKIVYLGALARESTESSPHMRSRHRVGEILRESGVTTIEFRASVIIGSGSMPFESIRALVERLPIMITPRWVRQPLQPIAASDLRSYLLRAVEIENSGSRIVEVGGADVVSFLDLMRIYAKKRGLKRIMINVPVISPSLSSHWLRIVTPAHYQVGRRIVDSSIHESVVDQAPHSDFDIPVLTTDQAIEQALKNEHDELRFVDRIEEPDSTNLKVDRSQFGTRFIEQRIVKVNANKEQVTGILDRIGGRHGWYWATWLWRLRGAMDKLVGGVGYRKSDHLKSLQVGDALDFWTVRRAESDRLTLEADMRLPGDAIFDLRVEASNEGGRTGTKIIHTVAFNPKGLLGYIYWFALLPIHSLVFNKMVSSIASKVEARVREHQQ